MKILVSNPSKQYTNHTVKALLQNNNVVFFTSFWYKPNNVFWKFIGSLNGGLKNQFLKKSDNSINPDNVQTSIPGTLYKFFGRFFIKDVERWSYTEDRIHDAQATKRINKWKLDVVIGYEKSCRDTFIKAKQNNIPTILDLSQVHVDFIDQLRKSYPFFATISGSEQLHEKIVKLKKEEYELADHIIVLSSFAKQTLIDNGISESKVSVAHLGADLTQFNIQKSKKAEGLKLIFVGIVTMRKGIHLLIDMMKELEHLNISLTVIGPRGDASYLLNSNSKYPNIEYIEYLQHAELAAKLQASDVFILPSFLDSFAAVVIEAMACGLPVIISNNTGAKDAIDDSCGKIIDTGNLTQLKDSVLYFYNNKEVLETMGFNARKSAEHYTWNNYYNSINQIVQKIAPAN